MRRNRNNTHVFITTLHLSTLSLPATDSAVLPPDTKGLKVKQNSGLVKTHLVLKPDNSHLRPHSALLHPGQPLRRPSIPPLCLPPCSLPQPHTHSRASFASNKFNVTSPRLSSPSLPTQRPLLYSFRSLPPSPSLPFIIPFLSLAEFYTFTHKRDLGCAAQNIAFSDIKRIRPANFILLEDVELYGCLVRSFTTRARGTGLVQNKSSY